VVASGAARRGGARGDGSQSPSLRGSGRFAIAVWRAWRAEESQSPSLRGSGRFIIDGAGATDVWVAGLNPLHCGAVVASLARLRADADQLRSQSPSLRGSGRFRGARRWAPCRRQVSIPFIAGQWSLHFNAFPGRGFPPCLNPLHCGAVVASGPGYPHQEEGEEVSIPFIAGQWSLRRSKAGSRGAGRGSQSPSLRGSGRFLTSSPAPTSPRLSQSPSLRGSGRFMFVHGTRSGV